jgi:hypothetical protein
VEPNGLAPRRHLSEQSPKKEISPICSPRNKISFRSLSSGSESVDDGFTELLDLEKMVSHIFAYDSGIHKFSQIFF